MQRGRLDDELARMSTIVDELRPNTLLLLNESFASTDQREGSEIAAQILGALRDAGVKAVFVTHLVDFPRNVFESGAPDVLFLRAGRLENGERTFRIAPAAPLATSYAGDLYREVFAEDAEPDPLGNRQHIHDV